MVIILQSTQSTTKLAWIGICGVHSTGQLFKIFQGMASTSFIIIHGKRYLETAQEIQ